MAVNDIFLARGQGKILPGVAQGRARVIKSVQAVAGIGLVPIIQKLIMQQRPAHKGSLVGADPEHPAQAQAAGCHTHTVGIHTGAAMLKAGFFL